MANGVPGLALRVRCLNYYEHHIGDYAAATSHLSWDEDLAYTRLLRAYYHNERGIADSERHRVVRATTAAQRRAVDSVLAEFFVKSNGIWQQKRADMELNRFKDKQRKAQASANARWSQSERNANASDTKHANALRTQSERNAHQSPDTKPISEPNGSGASAPPTDRDLVFANGVTLLTASGVKESNARSFLAAQCKAHGEGAVKSALDQCAAEGPIQPIPWLQTTLGAINGSGKRRKVDALMDGNVAAAKRYMETHGER